MSRRIRSFLLKSLHIAAVPGFFFLTGCPKDDIEEGEWGLQERPSNPNCLAFDRPTGQGSAELEAAFPALSFQQPTALEQVPGEGSHWFVAEKSGRIVLFENQSSVTSIGVALDIQDRVDSSASEMGLLGLAFHPQFSSTGAIYVNYTASAGSTRETRIARFTSTDGGVSFDASSEAILLTYEQPYSNHNGGDLAFGPDGALYIAVGDGGLAGDPYSHGQNPDTLLGSILRIDVDGGSPYAIPSNNPFAEVGGAPEIYAWGFRNPWRMSFDTLTGDLWVADVGQNLWEEIDRVDLGGNYGWRGREGSACYDESLCDDASYIDPVAEYPHSGGVGSVTGGFVYRGSAMPDLFGVYLFTDFYFDTIQGVFYDSTTGAGEIREVVAGGNNRYFSTFGEGEDGELLLADYGSGALFHLVPSSSGGASGGPPTWLSETGCVNPADPSEMDPGLIPYEVNLPLWSDDTTKDRWIALPDGKTVDIDENGHLAFPTGTVLVKRFYWDETLLEVRLLVHHDDGDWSGVSYKWSEEDGDGVLVSGGASIDLGEFLWNVPSSAQCLTCHTSPGDRPLGTTVGQLNRDFAYPSGIASNQLGTLEHIEAFSQPLPDVPEQLGSTPTLEGSASDEAKARAYLQVQCAHCHQDEVTPNVTIDLRETTALDAMGICGEEPQRGDLGVAGAVLLDPGNPDNSILSLRMHATEANRMPPLGTRVVHEEGAALVDTWIRSLTSCDP